MIDKDGLNKSGRLNDAVFMVFDVIMISISLLAFTEKGLKRVKINGNLLEGTEMKNKEFLDSVEKR